MCCNSWGRKRSDTTERLNRTELNWGVLPWVYPVLDSLGFLDLGDYFFPHVRNVFDYSLLKYFLMVFLFVFFFWDSYNLNVGVFSKRSLRFSSFLLIRYSFFFSDSFISTILFSNSLILSSACYSTICCLQSVSDLIYWVIHYILTLFLFLLGPC